MGENFQFKTEQFSGPIEKLLELIELRKMEVTELSLAEVTADFLNYLNTLGVVEPRILADFVAVASKLLLIKSKALLPSLELSEEEEGEIKDLEERLEFYRQFRGAQDHVKALWGAKHMSFVRPFFALRVPVFYPSENITPERLCEELKYYFTILKEEHGEEGTMKVAMVSIEEKIEELLGRMKMTVSASFNDMSQKKNKGEVVALFLAILHLVRNQLIAIEQQSHFSDIMIQSAPTNGQARRDEGVATVQ